MPAFLSCIARIAVIAVALSSSKLAAQTPVVRIASDSRIELVAIVFRLAGASEYSQNQYAEYDAAVRKHFEAFRDHEAAALARELHDRRAVTFGTVIRLAIGLGPLPSVEPRVPWDSVLPGRVPGAEMERFVNALRAFVTATRADEFFAAQKAVYDSAAQRIRRPVERVGAFSWAGGFFGTGADRAFVVSPLLANSLGNYGECVRPSRGPGAGRLECWQVIGHQRTDSAGFPVFDNELIATLVHEVGHSYVNPLGDARRADLERSLPRVHAAFTEVMAAQGYTSWMTVFSESLVRAAVARFFAAHGTTAEQRTYMGDQRALGWLWLDELAALLAAYEAERRAYATLETFMPKIVAYYDSLPDRIPAIRQRYEAARPRVVSISLPAAEGSVVDPDLKEIVVRFDRPVEDHRFGVVPLFVGRRPTSMQMPPPPVTGHALDPAGTTLRISVALRPASEYAFQLNTPNGFGFRTSDGVPLQAYVIRFRTGGR